MMLASVVRRSLKLTCIKLDSGQVQHTIAIATTHCGQVQHTIVIATTHCDAMGVDIRLRIGHSRFADTQAPAHAYCLEETSCTLIALHGAFEERASDRTVGHCNARYYCCKHLQ
ncbi:uncharacterized protein LOC135813627 [Sycon ciliatum]|uniref:uncharacterized protein LOC135813627 n=1 Tax=Sycon ciliatum TaxID=27933 RepID=UPI0031F649D6